MKLFQLLFILVLPIMVLTSCGSDDDDSGGGGGRVDTETDPSCLTEEQRTDIVGILNNATERRVINGTASGSFRSSDGDIVTSDDFEGSYTVIQQNANTWQWTEEFCEGGDDCRFNDEGTLGFANGCFNVDGSRATILSSTNSRVRYTTTDNGLTTTSSITVPDTGRARISSRVVINGQTISWDFVSTDGGGTTGGSTTGDDGATTGSTTGDSGTTGATTGDTGTTGTTTGDTNGSTTGGAGTTGTTTGDTGTTTGTTAGFGL